MSKWVIIGSGSLMSFWRRKSNQNSVSSFNLNILNNVNAMVDKYLEFILLTLTY